MRGKKGGVRAAVVVGGWLLMPSARAQAHTTFPGLGELASGFLHPLTTPAHVLILLALGLWLGQYPPPRLKEPATVFALATAGGLLLALAAHVGGVYPPVLAGVGLGVGACVAAGGRVPFWVKLLACGVAALALGMDSGPDAGVPTLSGAKIIGATWVSLTLCLVNVTFYVSLLPPVYWVRIGVRVLGSWIVAIEFLLLAFALRR